MLLLAISSAKIIELSSKLLPKKVLTNYLFSIVMFYDHSDKSKELQQIF